MTNPNFSCQFISDIHLEYFGDSINVLDFLTPTCENIALLGDIGYPNAKNYASFIDQCSKLFKKVFVITGNHEYYMCKESNCNMTDVDKLVEKICKNYSNVHFLNNSVFELDDSTIILGTTLWSFIPTNEQIIVEMALNDYNYIRLNNKKLRPSDINMIFKCNLDWLKTKLNNYNDKNVIILSHHTPSFKSIAPQFKGHACNCAYANDLDKFIEVFPNIKFWLFGHTHASIEFKVGSSTCLSNPLGYKRFVNESGFENESYKKDKFITL